MFQSTLRSTLAAAAAVIATTLIVAGPADAQDRYGDAYRDDLVKDGYPVPVPAPEPGYREPPPPSYKDDRAPPPPVYRQSSTCLSKPALRLALKEQGWHNFDDVEYRGKLAVMTADNDRGRRFDVEFDACSGDVVDARPIVVEHIPPPRYYAPPRYYGYYYGPPRPLVGLHVHRRWDWR